MGEQVVVKRFTSGLLEGLWVEERTSVPFRVGEEVGSLLGSSAYVIEDVREVG